MVGKLEEYSSIESFKTALETLKNLASFARYETKGETGSNEKCYRIFTRPLDEMDRWDEFEGYNPSESTWRRYVCTANRYLGCMVKQGIMPSPIHGAQVMIEARVPWRKCGKYSDAAVGNAPRLEDDKALSDFYVSQEDLILQECMSESMVQISDITKMWVDKDAPDDVWARAKAFGAKHNIPIFQGIPCPDEDSKRMTRLVEENQFKDYQAAEMIGLGVSSKPNDWGLTDLKLSELGKYLLNRSHVCFRGPRPAGDSVVAALAEAQDEAFSDTRAIGASDALVVKNERLRVKPLWGYEAPEKACDIP